MMLSVLVIVVGWFLWLCWRHGDVRFLPPRAPAEWILYPNPPDILAHSVVRPGRELITVFRRSFAVETIPSSARLRVQAFENVAVRINNEPLTLPEGAKDNWKQPVELEVGPTLRRGTNLISVNVSNRAGPPALWLHLEGGQVRLVTDGAWEASCAGAIWQPAQRATSPRPIRKGNWMYSGEETWSSLRIRSGTHLGLILISVSVVWLFLRRLRRNREAAERALSAEALVMVVGLMIFWGMLFVNNVGSMPPSAGFDAKEHLEYIRFIQERHALPLAEEGWETHQPPLYYLLAAVGLKILSLSPMDAGGLAVLRFLSLLMGLGMILLVYASLRLVFRNEARRPLLGTLIAALLPAHLYQGHYVSNEMPMALLVSGALYLCLRILRSEEDQPRTYAVLGICLGGALLTKVSALIVVPIVLVVLMARLLARRSVAAKQWASTVGLLLLLCVLISGWHYWRAWSTTGNVFNFHGKSAYGTAWWQEDGYRTAAYYGRFGESLARPLFSGFHSFGDGVFSTLWGDGLCGGCISIDSRPPWNYELMAGGYLLSLIPMAGALIGLIAAGWQLIRRLTHDWLLLLGTVLAFLFALTYISLAAPGTSQVRASFGLMVLIPFCALAALGLDLMAQPHPWLRAGLSVVLIWWALNNACTYWIPRSSAQAQYLRAGWLFKEGRVEDAARIAESALKLHPGDGKLRSLLADAWHHLDEHARARRLVEETLKMNTNDPRPHLDMAAELANEGRFFEASEHVSRAIELAPDRATARRLLVDMLFRQEKHDAALAACREALRVRPYDAELQALLATLTAPSHPGERKER